MLRTRIIKLLRNCAAALEGALYRGTGVKGSIPTQSPPAHSRQTGAAGPSKTHRRAFHPTRQARNLFQGTAAAGGSSPAFESTPSALPPSPAALPSLPPSVAIAAAALSLPGPPLPRNGFSEEVSAREAALITRDCEASAADSALAPDGERAEPGVKGTWLAAPPRRVIDCWFALPRGAAARERDRASSSDTERRERGRAETDRRTGCYSGRGLWT